MISFGQLNSDNANVFSYGVYGSSINTGSGDDSININASSVSLTRNLWGWESREIGLGQSEAVGLEKSAINTGSGDDKVEISAYSFGTNTNSWAIRDSSIDTGIGNDTVILNASDLAVSIGEAIEPAYGAVNSSINLGSGDDSLIINASGEALSIGWSWNQSALAAAYGVIDLSLIHI